MDKREYELREYTVQYSAEYEDHSFDHAFGTKVQRGYVAYIDDVLCEGRSVWGALSVDKRRELEQAVQEYVDTWGSDD